MTRFYRTMTDKELRKALDSATPEEVQDAIVHGDLLPGRLQAIRATLETGLAISLGSPDEPPRIMEEDAGAPDAMLLEARKQTALLEDILGALKRRKE